MDGDYWTTLSSEKRRPKTRTFDDEERTVSARKTENPRSGRRKSQGKSIKRRKGGNKTAGPPKTEVETPERPPLAPTAVHFGDTTPAALLQHLSQLSTTATPQGQPIVFNFYIGGK